MATLTYIPEILEEHFEELAFLLHLRAAQISSTRMLYRQFIDLDDRIHGHLDGLLAVSGPAIDLAKTHLAGDDPLNLRAAAFVLARLDPGASADALISKLLDPALAAPVAEALMLARPASLTAALKKLASDANAALPAAIATEILATYSPADVQPQKLAALLAHAAPPVRAAAWRVAQNLPEPRQPAQYKTGCGDADPSVRDAALTAAAWASQPFVLDFCRPLLKKHAPENIAPLQLWTILAPPTETSPVLPELLKAAALGPQRFDLLACTGLPAAVPHLLAAMRLDPESAAAAAEAFARLTNFMPAAKAQAKITPPGAKPSDFEKEFLPEVGVPDADVAAKYWSSVQSSLGSSARIARGKVVDPFPSLDVLLDLDCAARDAVLLRNIATVPDLKKLAPRSARWSFPQKSA